MFFKHAPSLLTVNVKAAHVLQHGKSDVKKGILVNNRMLTTERSKLSEETMLWKTWSGSLTHITQGSKKLSHQEATDFC